MKKSMLYVMIVVLLCVISSGVTYIIMSEKDNNKVIDTDKDKEQDKNEEVKKDSIKLKDVKLVGDNIFQEFEVTLNGKTNIMKINYTYKYNWETLEHNIVGNPWYDNEYSYCQVYTQDIIPCHTMFKIKDNKIYYLKSKLKENYSQNDYGTLEERVYTINNDKLEYKVINKYKIIEMANMT